MIIKKKKNNFQILEKRNRFIKIFLSFFLFTIIFSFAFLSGAYLYRIGEVKKYYNQITNIPKTIQNTINTLANPSESILIDLSFEAEKKLEYDSIHLGEYAIYNKENWVNCVLKYKDKKYDAKIRLAGAHSDHRNNSKEFSYRVELKNDEYLFGMREFTILEPSRRSNLMEWVFMKLLKEENLIYHRILFKNIIINGELKGFKMIEEQYDKTLIENNNLRDAPIIGFDKDKMLKDLNNSIYNDLNNSIYSYSFPINFFLTAPIKVNKENYYMSDENMKVLVNQSVDLLESFRQGLLEPSKVFDVNAMAKLIAIRVLLSSVEFDWRDIKFYFNPFTSKLVPIGREISSHLNDPRSQIKWWKSINISENKEYDFANMVLSDPIIYEKFLKEINKFTKDNYINNFLKKYEYDLKYLESKLYFINGYKFPYENLINSSKVISDLFSFNNNNLFIYFSEDTKQELKIGSKIIELNIIPTNIVPIKIGCLYSENIKIFCPIEEIILKGNPLKPLRFEKIIFKLEENLYSNETSKINLENIYLSYKTIGQSRNYFVKTRSWLYKNFKYSKDLTLEKSSDNLQNIEWLKTDHKNKKIFIKKGTWELRETVKFPKNYSVYINEDTKIFLKNSSFIFQGPIIINGTKSKPVVIASLTKNDSNGSGILVLSAKTKSKLNNVIFKNLSKPINIDLNLTGSITFYESDVEILNTSFMENKNADDYLNIVRSKFILKDSIFINIFSDALDSDFSESTIYNSVFKYVGNDSIDYSGSLSNIEDVVIHSSKDKGISVGENSKVEIQNIVIADSFIGIASKDNSRVQVRKYQNNNLNYIAAAYIKKNKFGPAEINFQNYEILDNTKIIVDKNSIIKFNYDSALKNEIKYSNINSELIEYIK